MRLRISFAMFTVLLFSASAPTVERAQAADNKLDQKVSAIVKQVADVFKNAKSLHVDISLEVTRSVMVRSESSMPMLPAISSSRLILPTGPARRSTRRPASRLSATARTYLRTA